MRLILLWPRGGPSLRELCTTLEKEGHEIIYVVSTDSKVYVPEDALYHDHYDAWDGKRAPAFEGKRISPVTRKELVSRYELESMVLTMMNKRYDRVPVEARKHQYHEMLAYWIHVFETLRPDGVIFQIVPHSVYNYIAFELARERKLFTYMFEEAPVGDRLLSYNDFWHGNDSLRERIQHYRTHPITLSQLEPQIQHYWKIHSRPVGGEQPWYLQEIRRNASGVGLWRIRGKALIRALLSGTLLKLIMGFIRRKVLPGLSAEYHRVARKPDYKKPFVYLPLQFQPERTTSPHGDVYHDQLLVAEILSAALPDGWEIITKEHPSQWLVRHKTQYNSVRWPGYYLHLASIPHVRIAPVDTNSFELLEKSETVSVITGTAGIEALIRGKRPLVFGNIWYRDCPGVCEVSSVEDCRQALAQSRNKVPEKDILAFLKAYEESSVRTHINQQSDSPNPISDEEGTRAMTVLLLRGLRAYVKTS